VCVCVVCVCGVCVWCVCVCVYMCVCVGVRVCVYTAHTHTTGKYAAITPTTSISTDEIEPLL